LGTKDFCIQTNGRFSHLSFERPHDAISTCQTHGGENSELDGICNYQSCEGKHHDRISSQPLHGIPERQRHRELAEEMGWGKKSIAFMGTAANMQYAVLSRCSWRDLEVHALATAGVTGNATCAGDPARYHREGERWVPCEQPAGTINIMLHINHSLSPAALTRAVVTMTEAKTAALMDLQIGSKSSSSLATGTGTDQFAICAPMGEGEPLTWAGAHTKLGELIGKAVKDSVMGALEWQNGLDLKRCRNIFHLLGRFGFSEDVWKSMLLPHAGEEQWPFFEANRDAVVHDPAVSACSSALASLMDQERKGHLPPSGILNQARHLCALMVVQVGNSPERFSAVLDELQGVGAPLEVLSKGLVLAWEKKWS
jgi:adenosylcobinamide hydrolase